MAHPKTAEKRTKAPGAGKIAARIARLQSELDAIFALVETLEKNAVARSDGERVRSGMLPCNLATLERAAIDAALRETGGNQMRAAALLGINRATLYRRLAIYAKADKAQRKSPTGAKKRETRRA